MEYETIQLEVSDGIATVTLNRPDRLNAFNVRMEEELADAFSKCDEDDDVRAVVLTGKGRAFCAGADMEAAGDTFKAYVQQAVQQEPGDQTPESGSKQGQGRQIEPWRLRKPVIAAINGHAVGVGLTLAMQCDVRYAAAGAKLSFAFVRRGIIPELASHVIVPHVIGLSRAAELMLSGKTILAEEAAEIGLVSKVLPAEEVYPAAMDLARDIAVNCAPVSVAISKRLLWESLSPSVSEVRAKENVLFAWAAMQPDAAEGVLAFLEKRTPKWKLRPSVDYPTWPQQ
jgi:enoyl-CoA hydratase/carnithine racemase